jgi:hypothetical protein
MNDPVDDQPALGIDGLQTYHERLQTLRLDLFCENQTALSPEAEAYVCLAIDALSQAGHFLQVATYRLMKKE